MSAPLLSILRAGMACPLGLRRAPAIAAMRAGLVMFDADEDRDDVCVSRTGPLAAELGRAARVEALAERALTEVLEQPLSGGWPARLPVFLALPELDHGPEARDPILAMIRERVHRSAAVEAVLDHRSIVPCSRAGVFGALRWAAQVVAEGRFAHILVGAADSLVDAASIDRLDHAGYLLNASNRDGRVIGEAAVFLLVSAPGSARDLEPLAALAFIGETQSPDCFDRFRVGETPVQAGALTELFHGARAAHPGRVDLVASAQPSESDWSRELSYAYLRNVDLMPEPMRVVQTGAEIGDAGVASGAVAVVRALSELQPSWWRQPDDSALAYAVSDRGHAGAAVLRRLS